MKIIMIMRIFISEPPPPWQEELNSTTVVTTTDQEGTWWVLKCVIADFHKWSVNGGNESVLYACWGDHFKTIQRYLRAYFSQCKDSKKVNESLRVLKSTILRYCLSHYNRLLAQILNRKIHDAPVLNDQSEASI